MNKILKKIILILLFFGNSLLMADCQMQLFNISSAPGTRILEFVNQIANECSLTVIVKDRYAKNILRNRLNKIDLKNATLDDVLNIVLKENSLNYELKDSILKISYLITKTFHIDYITTKRKGESTTDASVDIGGQSSGGGGSGNDVNKIESKDEFDFWKNTKEEIYSIINRPEDSYKAPEPIINQEAGLITVTGTLPQIKRVENYLKNVQERLHKEVMIDVSIIAVTLNRDFTKGIDWSRFAANFNGTLDFNYNGSGSQILNQTSSSASTTVFSSQFNINGLLNFLETNGDVKILSNPKILTLNNQPALITVGKTINYNVPTQVTITESGNLGTQSYTPSSIFVGILLNITPEITDDGYIILRINPSVSELNDPTQLEISQNQKFREIAPDTKVKKISSVLKVKDGSTIIMGGLITNTKNLSVNGVPILKDLPIIGYAFKSQKQDFNNVELVFVIKPKIIKQDKKTITLKDLGYKSIK